MHLKNHAKHVKYSQNITAVKAKHTLDPTVDIHVHIHCIQYNIYITS